MWMTVWRPLVVMVGLGGLGGAGLMTSIVSLNPAASDAVMAFGLFLMALQAVVSIGLIVAGVWGPVRRWAGALTGHPER